ncbi:unnamed protein product [Durusdinium trenchii]|uniref:Uncharacterized protein n=1 Tax=Durusdinium trenchii TaxID=1381693 RepID=A0ABP0Q5N6_9DINO
MQGKLRQPFTASKVLKVPFQKEHQQIKIKYINVRKMLKMHKVDRGTSNPWGSGCPRQAMHPAVPVAEPRQRRTCSACTKTHSGHTASALQGLDNKTMGHNG